MDANSSSTTGGHLVYTWSGRPARMSISGDQYRSLLCYVDELTAMQGCDNTLHHAQAWARAHRLDWARLSRSLRGLGCFCDCEVTLNRVSFNQADDSQ
ncbi:MAG TPA: DUF2695 domain-containing protein [Micromonosporaceae bacterium]